MLCWKPLGQESELQMHGQWLGRSRKIWWQLKTRDWRPESQKHRTMPCWLLTQTVWAILQVPTMRKMGKIRIMQTQSRTSWTKMMNPAEWWAWSPKLNCSAYRGLGWTRGFLTKWHNWDGGTQPTACLKETQCTAHPKWMVWQSLNREWMMMQLHLRRQHFECRWTILTMSPEYCQWRVGIFDLEIVILGEVNGSRGQCWVYPVFHRPQCQSQHSI